MRHTRSLGLLLAGLLACVVAWPGAAQGPSVAPSNPVSIDLEQPLSGPGVLATDQEAADLVGRMRSSVFGPEQLDATIALLATVGVEVVDEATGQPLRSVSGEPSPMRFLDWQARAMALEAWAGSGSLGSDLDAAIPTPDTAPLTSSLIAAWLAAADTRAGRLGRALMAGQDVTDPTTLVVPGLVLTLMTADVLADGSPGQARRSDRAAVAYAAMSDRGPRTAQGICTGATRFMESVISAVFEALKVRARSGAGKVLGDIWNWLVDRGADITRFVTGVLTEPVKAIIRTVVGSIATAAQAIAAIVPYTVTVTADPSAFTLPTDPGPPIEGSFRATVTAGDLPDWPPALRDCAQAAGTTLPSFRPGGEPVTWSAIINADGRVFRGAAEAVLDQGGSARLRFTSATEPPELADGDLVSTTARVTVVVRRPALQDQARQLVLGQLLGRLPDLVRPAVEEALRPIVDGLLSRLTLLAEARGAGTLLVRYHVPRPTATPDPTDEPTPDEPSGAVWVHFERPASARVLPGRILELVACEGRDGPWVGWLATGGLDSTARDPLRIAFAYFPIEFQVPGGEGLVITSARGTVDTPSWPITFSYLLEVTLRSDTLGIRQLNETSIPWYPGLSALPIEPAPADMCPGA